MANQCIMCGNTEHVPSTMTHVFTASNGEKVLIDNIPVTECTQCGEQTLSWETTEHIMKIVQAASNRTLNAPRAMPVYEYA